MFDFCCSRQINFSLSSLIWILTVLVLKVSWISSISWCGLVWVSRASRGLVRLTQSLNFKTRPVRIPNARRKARNIIWFEQKKSRNQSSFVFSTISATVGLTRFSRSNSNTRCKTPYLSRFWSRVVSSVSWAPRQNLAGQNSFFNSFFTVKI